MESKEKPLTGAAQVVAQASEEAQSKKEESVLKRLQLYYLATLRSGAASKVKSVRRALKRGKIGPAGIIHRPFNNRKNTCKRKGHTSRLITVQKKQFYDRIQRSFSA